MAVHEGQLSMFDAPESDTRAENSCRNCLHSSILRRPVPVRGNGANAAIHGYCFKTVGARYPIYVPDGRCKDWRAR